MRLKTRVPCEYQILGIHALFASFVAGVIGIYKVFNGYGLATLINVIWAFYHVFMLGMVFYYNCSFEPYEVKPVFIESKDQDIGVLI